MGVFETFCTGYILVIFYSLHQTSSTFPPYKYLIIVRKCRAYLCYNNDPASYNWILMSVNPSFEGLL